MSDATTTFFDEPFRDTVTAALTPIDGFSRRPVRTGITACLWDPAAQAALPARMVCNRSGSFVLLDRPRKVFYVFRLDPSAAGYRGPVDIGFTPMDGDFERVVRLEPLSTFPFGDTTTLVRGMVCNGFVGDGRNRRAVPAAGVRISVLPATPGEPIRWSTTSDLRGNFALPLVVSRGPGERLAPRPVRLRFGRDSGPPLDLDHDLVEGRVHAFSGAVDLTQPAQAQPDLQPVD